MIPTTVALGYKEGPVVLNFILSFFSGTYLKGGSNLPIFKISYNVFHFQIYGFVIIFHLTGAV